MTKKEVYKQLEQLVRENTENISSLKCLEEEVINEAASSMIEFCRAQIRAKYV